MKKKVLGTYDYCFDDKNEIMIVEWVDTKCVMFSVILANWHVESHNYRTDNFFPSYGLRAGTIGQTIFTLIFVIFYRYAELYFLNFSVPWKVF